MSGSSRRAEQAGDVADRLVLSYRAVEVDQAGSNGWELADSDWIRERVNEPTYLTYLRRVHGGEVCVGEEWKEFVNCGCASPEDVILRVEAVEGGSVFATETAVEIRPRSEFVEA